MEGVLLQQRERIGGNLGPRTAYRVGAVLRSDTLPCFLDDPLPEATPAPVNLNGIGQHKNRAEERVITIEIKQLEKRRLRRQKPCLPHFRQCNGSLLPPAFRPLYGG